ncbi:MAG: hypothetical protein QNJ53_11175 [Pleurocapsa sp. MO_192.B19]|nr:hypothetical protein [Pleurocapsa sp. MO_192.B19]
MSQSTETSPKAPKDPIKLTARAVNYLIKILPKGTAYCIGIVLVVMMTGRLVQSKGSLARAVLPLVLHLKWGWHRVERAMERGKVPLDKMFERAFNWCMSNLPVETVALGEKQREVLAIDSSTIARWRAKLGMELLGKGFHHRAGKAIKANIIAAVTSVVFIAGVRVGLVRRVRFGESCATAVAAIFENLPRSEGHRLLVVDAGIATQEQFSQATEQDALLGRLRINGKLRCAPPPRPERPGPGCPKKHGNILHPGWDKPEVPPDEEMVAMHIKGELRLRRWQQLHFEAFPDTVLDVVRIDHPDYEKPLLLGTIARELTTEQIWAGYNHRSPIETNFFVAQDSAGMEMPRAWTEKAIKRRIGLAMLVGFVLKAIAAVCEPLPIGPWDRRPQPTAGRLANYLDIHIHNFVALALAGVKPRNYQKIQIPQKRKDLPLLDAA